MKVFIASKLNRTQSENSEVLSASTTTLQATNIQETTDTDGDKCYSITYDNNGVTATGVYKQKNYIIAVMGG